MDTVNPRKLSAERLAVSQRNYRRARDRALTKLRRLYEDEYRALLAQEKAQDEANGMAWDSLDRSPLSRTITIPTAQQDGTLSTDSGEKAGNNGGEE